MLISLLMMAALAFEAPSAAPIGSMKVKNHRWKLKLHLDLSKGIQGGGVSGPDDHCIRDVDVPVVTEQENELGAYVSFDPCTMMLKDKKGGTPEKNEIFPSIKINYFTRSDRTYRNYMFTVYFRSEATGIPTRHPVNIIATTRGSGNDMELFGWAFSREPGGDSLGAWISVDSEE